MKDEGTRLNNFPELYKQRATVWAYCGPMILSSGFADASRYVFVDLNRKSYCPHYGLNVKCLLPSFVFEDLFFSQWCSCRRWRTIGRWAYLKEVCHWSRDLWVIALPWFHQSFWFLIHRNVISCAQGSTITSCQATPAVMPSLPW